MISPPIITVQCDRRVPGANGVEQCRRSLALELPTFVTSREQVRALFITLNPDWLITASAGLVLCPQCKRIEIGRAKIAEENACAALHP